MSVGREAARADSSTTAMLQNRAEQRIIFDFSSYLEGLRALVVPVSEGCPLEACVLGDRQQESQVGQHSRAEVGRTAFAVSAAISARAVVSVLDWGREPAMATKVL